MDRNYLTDLYFKWMCSIAFPDEHVRSHYIKALDLLNSMDFIYLLDLDENRLLDGINLRYHFSYASKMPYEYVSNELKDMRCSVLEMMIALAIRCEDSIMSDDRYGDRTYKWFWEMFSNLGLDRYSDDNWNEDEALIIVFNFLNRNYNYDGSGNIFRFDNPNFDVRKMEIWDQMGLYMNEIIRNDSMI